MFVARPYLFHAASVTRQSGSRAFHRRFYGCFSEIACRAGTVFGILSRMVKRAPLLALVRSLVFEGHDIRSQLDSTGRYAMPFQGEFQLSIRLFHYRAEQFTRGVTWHEQLELFCPLQGQVDVQMGSNLVSLQPGDMLVMDNVKLHHVVDRPGLDARVAVVSFRPEFIYSLGSSSHDFAFLLPFYAQLEAKPHVLRHSDKVSGDAHAALAFLLREYFMNPRKPHWEAACKCRLMDLLLI